MTKKNFTLCCVKFISVFENSSVKALIENAVQTYIKNKEIERFKNLTDEEKEDIGLLLLMQEADMDDKVSEAAMEDRKKGGYF